MVNASLMEETIDGGSLAPPAGLVERFGHRRAARIDEAYAAAARTILRQSMARERRARVRPTGEPWRGLLIDLVA